MSTNTTSSPAPIVKRRADYQQPDFLIQTVDIHFELESHETIVTCSTTVTRNGKHDKPLVLDGEQLKLLSVKLDGKEQSDYLQDETSLTIHTLKNEFELTIQNQIDPKGNSSLEGLYQSSGAFCTQCEAEGFRKITYFLDRPDVLAKYQVTIVGDKTLYPYLLSNGNKVDSGELADNKHWVKWSDPFNKPCYLFALVAGDFDLLEDTFVTASNRSVKLELFVDKGKAERGYHALESLKKSMAWDETEFGLEYDLDIYMIVAVDFFNMGAMENKGLNVFNSKFVLANEQTATDEDFFNIEAVIGHEYFHNWTGNRITCRDWFQLSLKEGLTVFRDQQFSNDMSSPIVNRIKNVRIMREHQFAEDASAMSHPIRPDEVIEMNNFYTVTVYDKGAEVIRMLHTLLGKQGFRAGMDLYFQRFDGQAVTCDDFVQAMQDANNKDLTQFRRWYSQSGTPQVTVSDTYEQETGLYKIEFSQQTKPTFDQAEKLNLVIPMRFSLIDQNHNQQLNSVIEEQIVELTEQTQVIEFSNQSSKPVLSLLHDFCAPVKLNYAYSRSDLVALMLKSPDDFTRWDASQRVFSQCILQLADQGEITKTQSIKDTVAVFDQVINDANLDLALKTEMLTIPSFESLFQQVESVDVEQLRKSRLQLLEAFADTYQTQWFDLYKSIQIPKYEYTVEQVKQRKIRNLVLKYLAASQHQHAQSIIEQQFLTADNMTDSIGALAAAQLGDLAEFDSLMQQFEQKWQADPLVLDKWFALQANTDRADILARLELLMGHAQYTINNPNRVRALIGSFAFYNVSGFHNIDGSGYKFVADYLIKLNDINPQVASRMITPLIQWQKVDVKRQALMQHQLMRIGDTPGLSKDLYEKITKSLP
ncbi:aminopeptidase N [Paraglaciecola aquimarina]|uniref:Aminopeptidase N n=1 Tax=Paraglaciecola algarum TaxID=3050085 RepID=A0ABS9D2J2_9ALTE|nr:aminopeptidase N [Paraglaciecola sp. G1-23]MCF2947143.1 aminopeptidase N [Paraglaciecola sp. G1-23]